MSPFDSLKEFHRQRALRRLPRHEPIEGPYNNSPVESWGDRAVAFVAFVIFVLIVFQGIQ